MPRGAFPFSVGIQTWRTCVGAFMFRKLEWPVLFLFGLRCVLKKCGCVQICVVCNKVFIVVVLRVIPISTFRIKKDKKGASEMYEVNFTPLKPVMLDYVLHYMDQANQVNFSNFECYHQLLPCHLWGKWRFNWFLFFFRTPLFVTFIVSSG